jgi:hypothetical protein
MKQNTATCLKAKIIEPLRHKGHQGISQKGYIRKLFEFSLVCRISGIVSWWQQNHSSDFVRR